MFFGTPNLTLDSISPCEPWTFVPGEIAEQIKKDKQSRQDWYRNPTTQHNFYTGLEPLNPNLRITKENNPPLFVHAFVADYDLPLTDARIDEQVAVMPIKPTRIERSLGGNARLVFELEEKFRVDSYLFCSFLHREAIKFLALDLLPGLDEGAFVSCERMFCNGGAWRATGAKPVSKIKVHSLLVKCAKEYNWPQKEDTVLPLDEAYKELVKKYSFEWPSDFVLDSQGPSFWVEGSTSPMSAIVKAGGMISFAAHAAKQFTPWDSPALLGPDFCKEYQNTRLFKATDNIFYDGHDYWRKMLNGEYLSQDVRVLTNHFRVNLKMSKKAGPSGCSQIEEAFTFIENNNRVTGVAPFVFMKPGLIEHKGSRYLNTYRGKPIELAPGTQKWGPHGNFPWFSHHMDTFFDPADQLAYFLAWWKYGLICAVNWMPEPGAVMSLMGGVHIGKTLTMREWVGISLGGYIDASDFLVNSNQFNSHLYESAFWAIDDDTATNSSGANLRFQTALKKCTAQTGHVCNEKFKKQSKVWWAGRIGITTNLDFVSSRLLAGLDNNSLDKVNMLRCVAERAGFKFPERLELAKILARELPCAARYIHDHTPPDFVIPDPRFGYLTYQDQSLLDQGNQTSPSAAFKECLIKGLTYFFKEAKEPVFAGTVSDIVQLLKGTTGDIIRYLKLEQANRYLEQIQKEGFFKMACETDRFKLRIWKFENFLTPEEMAKPSAPLPDQNPDEPSKFQLPTK